MKLKKQQGLKKQQIKKIIEAFKDQGFISTSHLMAEEKDLQTKISFRKEVFFFEGKDHLMVQYVFEEKTRRHAIFCTEHWAYIPTFFKKH